VEASLQLIAGSGIQSLSLREVARKIGVTTAAPYHHFKDRESLLLEIGIQGYAELLRSLEAAREGKKDGLEELEAETRTYLGFARQHAALYSVMFSAEVANKHHYPELKATADRCFHVVFASVARSTRLGERESAEAALCLWAALHGLIILDQSNFLQEDRSEQERIAVEGVLAIVRGFAGRGGAG
jgi:AcrR family transcriptional regulator